MQQSSSQGERCLTVDVALVPGFLAPDAADRADTVFIVIDVIRATTTLCVLFERDCRRVLVAAGIAAARRAREESGSDYLLAGESGGLAPAGFDFGNSPRELATARVAGQDVVFATTNGTRALRACLGGRAIYAGAFRNAGAVTARALAAVNAAPARPELRLSQQDDAGGSDASEAEAGQRRPDVVVVCSGRGDRPAFDDTICAGYLVERLISQASANGTRVDLREGARIARSCAAAALASGLDSGSVRDALAVSDAARAVDRVGLSDDLIWCAEVDASPVVPAVTALEGAEDLLVVEAASAP